MHYFTSLANEQQTQCSEFSLCFIREYFFLEIKSDSCHVSFSGFGPAAPTTKARLMESRSFSKFLMSSSMEDFLLIYTVLPDGGPFHFTIIGATNGDLESSRYILEVFKKALDILYPWL